MPGKRKVYKGQSSASQTSKSVEKRMEAAAKQIAKENAKAGGLRRNYQRLALNMTEHKVPKKAALTYAKRLQDLNDAKIAGRITQEEYFEDFYEDFYEPMYDEYDYDIEEDYEEEE